MRSEIVQRFLQSGFTFLDWALPQLDPDERRLVGPAADQAISAVRGLWADIANRPPRVGCEVDALAFMETDEYLALAARAMDEKVLRPLRARGILLEQFPAGARQAMRARGDDVVLSAESDAGPQ